MGNRELKFNEQGLLPAVIQDWLDGTVLMLGYMNQEALTRTLATKSVHFWSRSRQKLWEKGETSGHKLLVKDLFIDCDCDTILVKAQPTGPTCHTGERACFFSKLNEAGHEPIEKSQEAQGGILDSVLRVIAARKAAPQPGSYTTKLFEGGHDQILKKCEEDASGQDRSRGRSHVGLRRYQPAGACPYAHHSQKACSSGAGLPR